MAKNKKHNLEVTPIMALSIMLLFMMMIPLFVLSNNKRQIKLSQAKENKAVENYPEASGSPTPAKLRIYQ